VTVSVDPLLVEAEGPGLLTERLPVPWFCKSEALKATVRTVALTKVVGRDEPFHCTTELDSKPVPVMVMVAPVPEGTDFGEIEEMTGVGLFTRNVAALEIPPPGVGFCTVIWLVELPAKSEAGMLAVSEVELT
jgi:hypothetical protein